jgi:hypothetical protein
MPGAATVIDFNLNSARASMRAALRGIGPEELARELGPGWRSMESVLGEATMVLRDTLLAASEDDVPEVPGGFEARYARWGTGARPDKAFLGLHGIFSEHVEALAGAVQRLGPGRFDEPCDPPDAFDEEGLFSFATLGEMVFAALAYLHFLAGEASVVRLALGKPPAPDPFEELLGGAD